MEGLERGYCLDIQADTRLVNVIDKHYGWKLSSITKRDFLQQLPEEREKIIPPED